MSGHQDEPEQNEQEKKPRLNLTTSQVAASALAACCASIVASYLGLAGTVIGAAVGSVVATIAAAVYAHLFRRGGDRIRQTLLVNGRAPGAAESSASVVAEAAALPESARSRRPAGRFYGAQAESEAGAAPVNASAAHSPWMPEAPTSPTSPSGAAKRVLTVGSAGPRRGGKGGGILAALHRYRVSIGVAAAIVAVFCISITVGFLLGAPVRNAGANASPQHATTTTTTTVTEDGAHGDRTQQARQQPSDSADATSSSASPSGSASSATPSASQHASHSTSPSNSATAPTPRSTPSGTPTQTLSP